MSVSPLLTKARIIELLEALDAALAAQAVAGELYLVGGAVMCLVFESRPATRDLDAWFAPSTEMRRAAATVAQAYDLPPQWLNDAVKGMLAQTGEFSPFWEREHLKVFTAVPEYLLAMKCLSMRLGPEFFDLDDVRYLLRYLNIETYEQAVAVVTRYYPAKRIPSKTLYALEELLGA